MQKSKTIDYLIVVAVLISVAYTACSISGRQPDKKKYKDYQPVTATITDKLAGRTSRYGAKPTRYHIAFKTKDGKEHFASNIELGANLTPGDTVAVYYNPANPEEDVVLRLP
ncbi:MAG: DUF3592 domain-containing protein [Chitinophaga sp.]|uniref:DUF3592 domain-containing protein n=1 Tax=Chitinophaga sp. TaxID=1869181 RepID=UPI001B2EF475|nr:DUF3592 domain-containing protein [Chitinophaga sp.]MBO9730734.1 DUF3592 domain-containing protein [Chitinophaga sp.]